MKQLLKSHPAFAASLIMLAALTPLMILRDFTPANELRYLSIADEAIRDGHVFAFTNQGEAYADKPPLYFWLIMAMRLVFGGHSIFALSLLSFIPALVIIGVMDKWVVQESSRHSLISAFSERFASALMLGTSALFIGTAVFLRMDILMCMFIVLAMYSFYRMYVNSGNWKLHSYLLPLYIFLALFTKGPVGLLLPPLAILVFLLSEGKLRDTFKYLGWKTWGIIAGLCAIWFTGVWIDGGTSYLENLLFHQTVDRAVNAFHHKEPFWYYFMVIWYIIAPYSLLLIFGLAASFLTKGYRNVSARLYASVVITAFVMMSSFSSKLAIYLLPIFPFLVYLFFVQSGRFEKRWWIKISLAIPSLIFVLAGLLAVAALSLYGKVPQLAALMESYCFVLSPFTYIAISFLILGGCFSLWFIFRGNDWSKPVISIAVSMLACVFAASPMIPEANDFIGYANLCKAAGQMASESGTECRFVTLFVSRSENMDVYLGEDIVSYGRDPGEYLSSDIGDHILMVKTSHIAENQELVSRLHVLPYRQVGDYRCYYVKSGSN